jgi:PAS domain S-box-containing protein
MNLISLIEASPDSNFIIDFEGKITEVNAAAEAISGCSLTDLCGTGFPDHFSEPKRVLDNGRQALAEGIVPDDFLEFQHKDGHCFPISVHSSVYCDGEVSSSLKDDRCGFSVTNNQNGTGL